MKYGKGIVCATLVSLLGLPAANAQWLDPVTDAAIQRGFAEFVTNLSNQSEMMRRARDASALSTAQTSLTHAHVNQDTENVNSRMFQQTQQSQINGMGFGIFAPTSTGTSTAYSPFWFPSLIPGLNNFGNNAGLDIFGNPTGTGTSINTGGSTGSGGGTTTTTTSSAAAAGG